MSDIKQMAAITALNKMMRGSHFNICTIRDVAEMLGVQPEPEAYAVLHTLHCVNWTDMPRELFARMPALIQAALEGDMSFQFELKRAAEPLLLAGKVETAPKKGLIGRLFG